MSMTVHDCYRLGFGEPVAVSATTGEGMVDLYVALQPWIDASYASKGLSGVFLSPATVSPFSPSFLDISGSSRRHGIRTEGAGSGRSEGKAALGNIAGVAFEERDADGGSDSDKSYESDESDLDLANEEQEERIPIIRMAILGQPNVVSGESVQIKCQPSLYIFSVCTEARTLPGQVYTSQLPSQGAEVAYR